MIKTILRKFIPRQVLEARSRYLRDKEVREHDEEFGGRAAGEIFSAIYSRGMWGTAGQDGFCSGHGSHLPLHVAPYVEAISAFLQRFTPPLDVVDLGCGDFNIGSRIREKAGKYIACDVVPGLIERNKAVYGHLAVDFRVVDITKDDLPRGDVVIIRQVLQHLSNEAIQQVVRKLSGYRYLILTEYVPSGDFVPNVDQPTGSFSRMARGVPSGVVLTASPFGLRARTETVICETPEQDGVLKVIVYEF